MNDFGCCLLLDSIHFERVVAGVVLLGHDWLVARVVLEELLAQTLDLCHVVVILLL